MFFIIRSLLCVLASIPDMHDDFDQHRKENDSKRAHNRRIRHWIFPMPHTPVLVLASDFIRIVRSVVVIEHVAAVKCSRNVGAENGIQQKV